MTEVNRVLLVVEVAMRQAFKDRKRKCPKPTINELESMLNSDNPPTVQILPDGTIEKTSPIFISDLAKAAIEAIYADGFQIVPQLSDCAQTDRPTPSERGPND